MIMSEKVTLDIKNLYEMGVHKLELYVGTDGSHNSVNCTVTKEQGTNKKVDDFYSLLDKLGDTSTKTMDNSNIKNENTRDKDIDDSSLRAYAYGLDDSTKRKECYHNLIKGLINSLKELDKNNDFRAIIRHLM